MESFSAERADRTETPSGLGATEAGERKQPQGVDEGTAKELTAGTESESGLLREEEAVRRTPDLGEVSVETDFEQDEFAEAAAEPESGALREEPPGREGAGSGGNRPQRLPRLFGRRRRQRVLRPATNDAGKPAALTPEQRLLLLDTWQRSGLPASDLAALVGLSPHTLYDWKRKFHRDGPSGLMDRPRGSGRRGSQLPELTKRTILMLKQSNPEWGCQRISDLLYRGPALPASPSAVARVLHEAGYEVDETPTRPHPAKVQRFERARPNQLWQTDLFTFVLKRQNRRVYLVAFLDDHSRFVVGYGLHASQSSALVLEVLRAALTSYGGPEEILTDNGTQYVTWRGKSAFSKELEKRGIQQIVARPRHPQTLGKIERFWGTLWRECVEAAVFVDLGEARQRIGLFIDHYNFQRPHQGLGGLVPADRYFGAASEVKQTLAARVAANALELARHGLPKQALYLTGQVGGRPVSLHAEGERVILTGPEGERQEIDLSARPCDIPRSTVERLGCVPSAERTEDAVNLEVRSADGTHPTESVRVAHPATGSSDLPMSLPAPVCPAGVVSGVDVEAEEPAAPGTSPLDEGLRRLAEAFGAGEGGAP